MTLETVLRYDAFPWHYESLIGDRSIDRDVEWYLRQVRRFGGPLLDVACGTGRIALPVANDGVEVVGLDLSESMLRLARLKAEATAVDDRVRFHLAPMQAFDLVRGFGTASIPFASFSLLLDEPAQRDCLDCVRRHLKPGGALLMDLNEFDAERAVREADTRDWGPPAYDPDRDAWVTRRVRSVKLRDPRVIEYEFVYRMEYQAGPVSEQIIPFAFHTIGPVDAIAMLEAGGFEVIEATNGLDGRDFQLGDPRVFIAALRR